VAELALTLDRFEDLLSAKGAPVVDLFRPGKAVPESVPGLDGRLVLAAEVVELYQWHDGTDDLGGSSNVLVPLGWSFPPFAGQLDYLEESLEALSHSGSLSYWRRSWFPVLQFGLEALVVDCESCEVWSSSISLGETSLVAPSLEVFFSRVISAYEAGVFVVRDGRVGLADEDLDEKEFLSSRI
jgi:hypothetical protein